jgi:predicted RND superfamily exporter protein
MITAITFIKKYWKLVLVVVLILFVISWVHRGQKINQLQEENSRKDKNLEEITKKNGSELTITHDEFKTIDTPMAHKIDSVSKVAKISLKSIKNSEVISSSYKDTTRREAKSEAAQEIKPPKPMSVRYYKIPVKEDAECWGFKGYILSSDSNAKLVITQRTANNSIQRLEVSKRFLGFLWYTKKSEFKAFTDCGEIKIDKINFVKK